jgi:cell division control protein 7
MSERPSAPTSAADFEVLETIGTGSFSHVVHAVHRRTGTPVALKRIFWTNSPDRIVKEIKWLRSLDHPNIVRLLAIFREADQATLVLNYVAHVPFRSLLPQLRGDALRRYMRGLLSALAHIHARRIIHRDVKPSNYLFDPATQSGCLIDFGLCEEDLYIEPQQQPDARAGDDAPDLQHPERCQNRPRMLANRAGTRGFRAPEVLFLTWNQSAKIDVWGAGVILLSVLSHRYPFFKSPDDLTALVELSVVVGTARLRDAAWECGRRVRFPSECPGMDLRELCERANPYIAELGVADDAFDLLRRMLEPVPTRRLSAADALAHPFFDGL